MARAIARVFMVESHIVRAIDTRRVSCRSGNVGNAVRSMLPGRSSVLFAGLLGAGHLGSSGIAGCAYAAIRRTGGGRRARTADAILSLSPSRAVCVWHRLSRRLFRRARMSFHRFLAASHGRKGRASRSLFHLRMKSDRPLHVSVVCGGQME